MLNLIKILLIAGVAVALFGFFNLISRKARLRRGGAVDESGESKRRQAVPEMIECPECGRYVVPGPDLICDEDGCPMQDMSA